MKINRFFKLLTANILLAGSLFATSAFQLNINDETVEGSADLYLNNNFNLSNSSNYYLNIGAMLNEGESDSVDNRVFYTGFKVMNPLKNSAGLSFGIGMKGIYFTVNKNNDYFTTPIELYANYEINDMLLVQSQIAYAPKILSFSGINSYKEFRAKLNYKILADGYVFAGYRMMEASHEDYSKNINIDESLFAGFEVRF
jgi:hypothetical protein